MEMTDIIVADRVLDNLNAGDRPHLLRELATRTADIAHLDAQVIEKALRSREELGSTGVGQGVAIPHARIEGLMRFVGLFARLAKPIEFMSIDAKPVDLVFLLLIPSNAGNKHVAALALISRRLRDKGVLRNLRAAKGARELYGLLASTKPSGE